MAHGSALSRKPRAVSREAQPSLSIVSVHDTHLSRARHPSIRSARTIYPVPVTHLVDRRHPSIRCPSPIWSIDATRLSGARHPSCRSTPPIYPMPATHLVDRRHPSSQCRSAEPVARKWPFPKDLRPRERGCPTGLVSRLRTRVRALHLRVGAPGSRVGARWLDVATPRPARTPPEKPRTALWPCREQRSAACTRLVVSLAVDSGLAYARDGSADVARIPAGPGPRQRPRRFGT
jgi:hypothetical protein